jgi:hypothetical protein
MGMDGEGGEDVLDLSLVQLVRRTVAHCSAKSVPGP